MKVVPISFSTVDNFSYLVLDETSKKCAVIDVSNQWEDVSKVHLLATFSLTYEY